jgi:endonuclease-3 related protein
MRRINASRPIKAPQHSGASGRDPLLWEIYQRLYRAHGPQGWWPGDGPFDVVVGAILTQAAAWINVERAIDGMKQAGCWSMRAIHEAPVEEIASMIRPSVYFNAKARKLKAFAKYLVEGYAGDLSALLGQELGPLRKELLSIHGIGPETADDILVYAAGKPSFVIDSYTRRIVLRVGLLPENSKAGYQIYQELFHKHLNRDVSIFNEYHALLDHHAKVTCAKVPLCFTCCLKDICATGISRIASR